MVGNKGQMKIQQMSLMIVAVFIFFVIAGLFVINLEIKKIDTSAKASSERETRDLMHLLTTMTEFKYAPLDECISCLDKDKLEVLSRNTNYSRLWPVASIEARTIYPREENLIPCPGVGCNYYEVIGNYENESRKLSTFVNLCYQVEENFNVQDRCEIAKLSVGIKVI